MQRRSQQQTPMWRVARRAGGLLLLVLGLALSLMALVSNPAGAQEGLEPCPEDLDQVTAGDSAVHVVKVAGLLDPVVQSHLLDRLDRAEAAEVEGFVIWLNSKGSVLDDDEYLELARRLADSPVTIAIWVGQSGATATGGAAELLGVADLVGVSAGSTIGDTGPARLPESFGPAFGEATDRLRTAVLEPAVDFGRLEQVFVMLRRGPTLELLYTNQSGDVAEAGP